MLIKGLILASIFLSQNVFAYVRGGACNSALCDATGFLVITGITVLMLLSAAEDIREKGWIKGVTQNKVLVPLVVIIGGFVSVIWIIAQIYKADKDIAILLCAGIAIWLFLQIGKSDSDEKNS